MTDLELGLGHSGKVWERTSSAMDMKDAPGPGLCTALRMEYGKAITEGSQLISAGFRMIQVVRSDSGLAKLNNIPSHKPHVSPFTETCANPKSPAMLIL